MGAGPLRGILLLLHLCAVAAAGLLTVLHTLGIEGATDDLVADTREVLHTTTADKHNGVLLQVVSHTGDVGGYFDAAVEAHTCHLTQSRVRLLRCGGVNAGANTAAHRAALKRGGLGLGDLRRAALADQLVNRRHSRVLRWFDLYRNIQASALIASVWRCPCSLGYSNRAQACKRVAFVAHLARNPETSSHPAS
ncbi:hypothetical protein ARTHRO9AX_180639 [Arthrobacter sp. 9AX]|nr:hypothetical protein ARTHRO9AX_180639 [Arthrobacter sp. 9AX]